MIIWLAVSGLTFVVGGILALFLTQMSVLARAGRLGERVVNPDRYKPLLALLRDLDTPLDSVSRSASHQIIGVYLRSLTADFAALVAQVRLVMARSGADRPDLARLLVRRRVQFALAMSRIRLRLLLHQAGLARIESLTEDIASAVNRLGLFHQRTAEWTAQ